MLIRIIFLSIIYTIPAWSDSLKLKQSCLDYLRNYKSFFKTESIEEICAKVEQDDGCASRNGEPIFHVNFENKRKDSKRILVLSHIHGDEALAGNLGRFWLERLHSIEARNNWRVIPVVNPDGVQNKTRTNAIGIDINRNFPTKDWSKSALKYWQNDAKKSPRKFPGDVAGEEPETKCILHHLAEYKPDFIISIHTPLSVLDFDGPKMKKKVNYSYLPWKGLGNYPGSLGRYMWAERQVPVLTTELKDNLPVNEKPFEQLQDLIGTLVKADLK